MTAENGLKLSRSARSYKRSRPSGVRTLSLHVAIECVANFTTHAILSALTKKKKVFELLELKLRRGGTTYLRIKIAQCLFFIRSLVICSVLILKYAFYCTLKMQICVTESSERAPSSPGIKRKKMNDVAIRVTSRVSHLPPSLSPNASAFSDCATPSAPVPRNRSRRRSLAHTVDTDVFLLTAPFVLSRYF